MDSRCVLFTVSALRRSVQIILLSYLRYTSLPLQQVLIHYPALNTVIPALFSLHPLNLRIDLPLPSLPLLLDSIDLFFNGLISASLATLELSHALGLPLLQVESLLICSHCSICIDPLVMLRHASIVLDSFLMLLVHTTAA